VRLAAVASLCQLARTASSRAASDHCSTTSPGSTLSNGQHRMVEAQRRPPDRHRLAEAAAARIERWHRENRLGTARRVAARSNRGWSRPVGTSARDRRSTCRRARRRTSCSVRAVPTLATMAHRVGRRWRRSSGGSRVVPRSPSPLAWRGLRLFSISSPQARSWPSRASATRVSRDSPKSARAAVGGPCVA
jgi:hypothetical protein